MRYIIVILLGIIISFSQVYALTTPKIIQDNCYILKDGYIDTCPKYRQTLKSTNEKLYTTFSQQEQQAKNQKDIFLVLNKFLIQLQTTKKNLYKNRQLTPDNMFLLEYMSYLTNLYIREIQQYAQRKGVAKTLFSKTYYNQQQSGLIIASVSLFENNYTPQVYDTQITITAKIRNFGKQAISNIEDLYCFNTLGDTDYIFPLGMNDELFKPNHITNVVGTLTFKPNDLMSIPGEKELYCMLVYTQDNKEITTPFTHFTFLVE